MITTFDIAAPDLQVNSQIPRTGDNWEHSLSISHEAVGGSGRGKKKERATRKDKGIPRKKKNLITYVLCFDMERIAHACT
jgi:hypothetical protein